MAKLFAAYFTGVSQVEVGSEVSCHSALRFEQFTTLWTLLVDGAVSQEVCTKTTLLHKTFSADSALKEIKVGIKHNGLCDSIFHIHKSEAFHLPFS